jgi:hypothetical protein
MQPLYPITILQPDDAANIPNIIMQGCMTCIPFTLNNGGGIIISALQVALTEDFSIKGWFSSQPNGQPFDVDPPILATFSLLRSPFEIVVYDPSVSPPAPLSNTSYQSFYPIQPGLIYLNLLNLINRPNIFTFGMTVVS